ncbi:MAG: putative zinc finger/helix-turn-helix protein YgiT family [Bacteroidota bacterium]|nr:putative zinc finger/helix-turn-helix protein YgiT family [Bacteroidota bacterium]
MKSPLTGNEMKIHTSMENIVFRKEDFNVLYHFYLDEETGEQYTTTSLDEININQAYNAYRAKYGIPFPDEIKNIREKYGLSPNKMSEILGFGINVYRNYEAGEVPSVSNGKFLQQIKHPEFFLSVLRSSQQYDHKEYEKLRDKIDASLQGWASFEQVYEDYLLGDRTPNEFTGYRAPHLEKIANMVLYFAEQLKPYKTMLNKLLFYADFYNYKRTCFSISGASYRAIQMGPVPKNFNGVFEYAEEKGFIQINLIRYNDNIGEQFDKHENISFNKKLFNHIELDTLETVLQKFKGYNTKEIVDISHKEKAWSANVAEKALIDYKYSFELSAL